MDKDVKLFIVVFLSPLIIVAGIAFMLTFPDGGRLFAWGLAGFFIIAGMFFTAGRGEWALAGWNTMSDEEKQKYNMADIKRLMRAVGLMLIVMGFAFSPPIMEFSILLTFILAFASAAALLLCVLYPQQK